MKYEHINKWLLKIYVPFNLIFFYGKGNFCLSFWLLHASSRFHFCIQFTKCSKIVESRNNNGVLIEKKDN